MQDRCISPFELVMFSKNMLKRGNQFYTNPVLQICCQVVEFYILFRDKHLKNDAFTYYKIFLKRKKACVSYLQKQGLFVCFN